MTKEDIDLRELQLGIIEKRLERLEDIALLLAVEASRGMGMSGRPIYDFIDAIRDERKALGGG